MEKYLCVSIAGIQQVPVAEKCSSPRWLASGFKEVNVLCHSCWPVYGLHYFCYTFLCVIVILCKIYIFTLFKCAVQKCCSAASLEHSHLAKLKSYIHRPTPLFPLSSPWKPPFYFMLPTVDYLR
jgi:hypothetical protein